jgi:hypothetical protein
MVGVRGKYLGASQGIFPCAERKRGKGRKAALRGLERAHMRPGCYQVVAGRKVLSDLHFTRSSAEAVRDMLHELGYADGRVLFVQETAATGKDRRRQKNREEAEV